MDYEFLDDVELVETTTDNIDVYVMKVEGSDLEEAFIEL